MANPIDSLSSSLINLIGSYFEQFSVSPLRSNVSDDSAPAVHVVVSKTGQPLGVAGHGGRELDRVIASVPGAGVKSVVVGDPMLAQNLARLIGDLFSASLPFGIIAPERVGATAVGGFVAEAPKRRGRAKGSKNKAKGRRARITKSEGSDLTAVTTGQIKRRPGRLKKVVEANEPVKRRGRKPGSKNRPKEVVDVTAPAKRRGRLPGSKNKPKVA